MAKIPQKLCGMCKKFFYKKPNESFKFWRTRKYCSYFCYWKSKVGKAGYWKGKTFTEKHKSILRKPHKKMSVEVRKNMSRGKGKNNPSWKGGRTSKHEQIRKSLKYKLWREKVFERDNYTCQLCGKQGGNLNADHIKPFALYPKIRFKVSNGRTLCVPCHKKTETWGKTNGRLKTITPKV